MQEEMDNRKKPHSRIAGACTGGHLMAGTRNVASRWGHPMGPQVYGSLQLSEYARVSPIMSLV
jgi:hypothetical protein